MRKGSYSEELVKVDLYVEILRCDMLHADEMFALLHRESPSLQGGLNGVWAMEVQKTIETWNRQLHCWDTNIGAPAQKQ